MRHWIEVAKEASGVRCACGIEMNRLELEEYGKCLFCVEEEMEKDGRG